MSSSDVSLPGTTSLKRSRLLYPTPAPLTRYSPLPPTPGTYPGRDLRSHTQKISQKAASYYPSVTRVEKGEESDVQNAMAKVRKTSHSRARSTGAQNPEGTLMITRGESGVKYDGDEGESDAKRPGMETALALMPGQKSGLKKAATKVRGWSKATEVDALLISSMRRRYITTTVRYRRFDIILGIISLKLFCFLADVRRPRDPQGLYLRPPDPPVARPVAPLRCDLRPPWLGALHRLRP